MHSIFQHLEQVKPSQDGGYSISESARLYFEGYLEPFGFELSALQTFDSFIAAVRHCNSAEFDQLMTKPAPSDALRFVWKRMQQVVSK